MALNNAINAALPIAVGNGGTGATTLTDHGILLGNGTGAVTATAELSDGQLLIGSTGNPPVAATLSAGAGISIGEAAGAITISATGMGVWNVIAGTSATLDVNENYIANNAGLVTLTLPAAASVGDGFVVTGIGAGGWRIAQLAGQQIHFGIESTTTGAGGYLESTEDRDTVRLICVVEDLEFQVVYGIGNIAVE